MPTEQIVALLIAERDRLNKAIEALQGPVRRRGRPPKNHSAIASPVQEKKRGPKRTAAQNKAHSERMKKYWAARRKQAKAKG
jgi:hypothetical protein